MSLFVSARLEEKWLSARPTVAPGGWCCCCHCSAPCCCCGCSAGGQVGAECSIDEEL